MVPGCAGGGSTAGVAQMQAKIGKSLCKALVACCPPNLCPRGLACLALREAYKLQSYFKKIGFIEMLMQTRHALREYTVVTFINKKDKLSTAFYTADTDN